MNKVIFNDTKYTKWYYAIIEKRCLTVDIKESEVHHIIPRSLGGTDDPKNLVRLSYHDHAWCHWLLTKMTTGADLAKMRYAFNMMNVGGDHMGRVLDSRIVRAYAKNREELIKTHSEFMRGREPWNKGKKLEDEKYKSGRKNKGKKHTPDAIEKRINSMIKNGNNKRSEETKKKMSDWQKGIPKGSQSEDHKLAISVGSKGHKKSISHRNNVRNAVIGNISINKDGVEKKIKQPDLQSWLDQGWQKGGRKRA
jgi:hypothetical protein